MDNEKLKSIFFPVEKVPVEDIMPGYQHPSGISQAVIVTKPNGDKLVVNYCSPIYHLVKNEDIIPAFIGEFEKLWKVDVNAFSSAGYSQFFVDIILKNEAIKISEKDKIFPKVRISNSYDGRIKYNYAVGFMRQVCTNGLTVPVKGTETRIKKLHTPSLDELTNFSAIIKMVSEFNAKAEDLSEIYHELNSSKPRNPQARIREVIEETKFPSSLEQDVQASLQQDMEALGTEVVTDWLIYNAFNYQLNHNDELRSNFAKREIADQEVVSYLLDY